MTRSFLLLRGATTAALVLVATWLSVGCGDIVIPPKATEDATEGDGSDGSDSAAVAASDFAAFLGLAILALLLTQLVRR